MKRSRAGPLSALLMLVFGIGLIVAVRYPVIFFANGIAAAIIMGIVCLTALGLSITLFHDAVREDRK